MDMDAGSRWHMFPSVICATAQWINPIFLLHVLPTALVGQTSLGPLQVVIADGLRDTINAQLRETVLQHCSQSFAQCMLHSCWWMNWGILEHLLCEAMRSSYNNPSSKHNRIPRCDVIHLELAYLPRSLAPTACWTVAPDPFLWWHLTNTSHRTLSDQPLIRLVALGVYSAHVPFSFMLKVQKMTWKPA